MPLLLMLLAAPRCLRSCAAVEGPTLDQVYRRALLVVWPRSQALTNAQRAGFDTLQAVLQQRMLHAARLQQGMASSAAAAPATDGAAAAAAAAGDASLRRKLKQAHSRVRSAFKACVRLLEQDLQAPNANSYLLSKRVAGLLRQAVEAALEVGCSGCLWQWGPLRGRC